MGVFSESNLFGMTIRESATDGSDFTNPDADYRRLFLGEDGQLHVKDSAGAVTDIGSGTGAPDDAKYLVASLDAGLSAEIARPELDDYSAGSGAIDFSSPTADNAAITHTAETDMASKVTMTDVSTRRHLYVSSAIGTGDFDVRARITDMTITVPHTTTCNPLVGLFVADSSLTEATRLSIQYQGVQTTTAQTAYALGVVGTTGNGQIAYGLKLPIILRIARSGTTVTFYFSTSEGRTWQTQSTTTSSLNVGRLGILGTGGSTGTQTTVALVHWLRNG